MAYVKKDQPIIRSKKCLFCKAKVEEIDYKNVAALSRYLNRWNQIEPAGRTGTCAKHQRQLAKAIKYARHIALLPFVTQ